MFVVWRLRSMSISFLPPLTRGWVWMEARPIRLIIGALHDFPMTQVFLAFFFMAWVALSLSFGGWTVNAASHSLTIFGRLPVKAGGCGDACCCCCCCRCYHS